MLSASTQAEIRKASGRTLCLVIPTYNENENISKIVSRTQNLRKSLPLDLTLIVVDDSSSDGTAETVKEMMRQVKGLKLIERPKPLGIGSAYVDGFAYALAECGADYCGEMDADLQHPPEVLLEMCEMAEKGIDVVVASRYVKGGGSIGWSSGRRFVSKSANLISKLFIRAPIADSTSGFRVISARAIKGLLQTKLSSKGYAFQIESLYVYKKLGLSFGEVPYVFEERKAGETKLRWKEMARFAYVAMKIGIFGMRTGNEK
ncbi:MAG: polyprenol monophosphomannose synthase [Nitrososphaerales archaeon]